MKLIKQLLISIKTRTCHGCLLLLLASNGFSATEPVSVATSTTTTTKTYTFKQLGWNNATTLNGYKPEYSLYFPVASNAKIQKITLNLKAEFSPTLSQGTRVDLKLNQNVVRRLSMQSDPGKEQTWDIDLPLTLLVPDWQAINFSAYLTSAQQLCSPDLWIYISPESTVTLTYTQLPFNGSLNQLPYPFINAKGIDPSSTLLVLPENADMQEIISLFHIAQRLGELAGDYQVQLGTSSIGKLSKEQSENNMILIGLADKLFNTNYPGEMADKVQIDEALKNGSGVITLTRSILNPLYAVLTLTGEDKPSLQKAIDAFDTPDFQSFTSGNLAIIKKADNTPADIFNKEWFQTTFNNIGYTNQSVSGLGTHKLTYMISLPNDRIPEKAKIETYITAPLMKSKESQITLLINDQKQASFWINNEQSLWTAKIDSDVLKPGKNKIDYLISLHLDDEQCTRQDYDQIWATIHAESKFSTFFGDTFPRTNLNQLPVPFDKKLIIIVPDHLSPSEINTYTSLFFKLGVLFDDNSMIFDIRSSNEVNEELIRTNNIMLIGSPDTNPWIKFALDFMPVKISAHSQILDTPTSGLEVADSQRQGLLELSLSPWSEDHAVLIIAGTDEASLSWSINALTNDGKRNSLSGNIALLNDAQSISVVNKHNSNYLSIKSKLYLYIQNTYRNTLYYIKNHPQVLIYLLVFIVPFFIYRRRKNK